MCLMNTGSHDRHVVFRLASLEHGLVDEMEFWLFLRPR
jgi:hypothetical protein